MSLQTLDRAMAVLRLLAEDPAGLRLIDAQRALGLSKPTAHRLLGSLLAHGLVEQNEETRKYFVGPALTALARARVDANADLGALCSPSVFRLAEESGDTVFVVRRVQLDTVCIARESGSYPIRAITVEVGTRRPLGVGAGGIAILGALAPDEAQRIIHSLARRLSAQPLTGVQQIQRSCGLAHRAGYSLSDEHVAKGVRGVAVSLRNALDEPVAAIGICAISERIRPNRIPHLVDMLHREGKLIESLLAQYRRGE